MAYGQSTLAGLLLLSLVIIVLFDDVHVPPMLDETPRDCVIAQAYAYLLLHKGRRYKKRT